VRLVRCCLFQAVAFILHHLSSCLPLLFLSSAYSPPALETCPWISRALSICPAGTARRGAGTSGFVLVQQSLHCTVHSVNGQSGYAALCARWRVWLCCTVHLVEDFLLQICGRAAHKCVPAVFLRQGRLPRCWCSGSAAHCSTTYLLLHAKCTQICTHLRVFESFFLL
jgi:hypothetical protein